MAINRYINGHQEAHAWQPTGIEVAHVWQLFRHIWHSKGIFLAVNRHIHGNQKAHTWQSKGTYMAVNGYIRNSHTHIVHTWQLFVHTRGTELAIKRNRNW